MDMDLKGNERLDDLQCKGRVIIQNKDIFCFGIDAVLLANFARAEKGECCMDLCTGNGIIPILMEAKNNAEHYVGLEIQPISAELAKRNVKINKVEDKIEIIQEDVKNVSAIFKGGAFNVVTVNPPYMNENHGLINPSEPKAIARHEILCTLEDIISQASIILKDKGRFYMVHRPQRLVQIIDVCKKNRLEPKRMRMIHPYADKAANMVLIEAIRGGKPQLTIEPPLIMYNKDQSFTKELLISTGNYNQE